MTMAEFPEEGRGELAARLEHVFQPRGIALVGASERSFWTKGIERNLRHYGYEGRVHAVNLRGSDVFGHPGHVRCSDIEGPVDVAYVAVPAATVLDSTRDAIAAGVKGVVILTSGLSEAGADGERTQQELLDLAHEHGIILFGPNSLGYVHTHSGSAVTGLGIPGNLRRGGVAFVTQSGALASELIYSASRQDVGVSFYASTGNEAMVALADIVDYLVDDPTTRVIAICAEAVRKPERLAAAARRAFAKGKPIVILKIGTGEIAARVAQAHTGSLVGDDHIFDAACESLGLIRVRSLDDLMLVAGLLDRPGDWSRTGTAFVSISGGACTLFAEAAEAYGLDLPAFSPETEAALRAILPPFATVMNPLDITGGAVSDPDLFSRAIEIIDRDGAIARVFSQIDIQELDSESPLVPLHKAVGDGLRACTPPGIHLVTMPRDIDEDLHAYLATVGIEQLSTGIHRTVRALGRVDWWARRRQRPAPPPRRHAENAGSERPVGERAVLRWLERAGVRVPPTITVHSADEAIAAARTIGDKLALKILSPDIAHKTEVGGVRLGLTEADVGEAYAAMVAGVAARAPGARLDGAQLAPMREGGLELIVSVVRDADWGPALMVGFGGIGVELLDDTCLRLLPVSAVDVRDMLAELRGFQLLQGYRGAEPADLDALVRTIGAIADAALSLGDDLDTLEVNPLFVRGSLIEALDGLAVWRAQ